MSQKQPTPVRSMTGIKPRELRDVYERARDAGCELTYGRNNHITVLSPGGGKLQGPLTGGARSHLALRTRLRRLGVTL
jgi:hypothetical protein